MYNSSFDEFLNNFIHPQSKSVHLFFSIESLLRSPWTQTSPTLLLSLPESAQLVLALPEPIDHYDLKLIAQLKKLGAGVFFNIEFLQHTSRHLLVKIKSHSQLSQSAQPFLHERVDLSSFSNLQIHP